MVPAVAAASAAGVSARVPVSAPVAVPAAVFGGDGGPSCAPAGPGRGGLPAAPPRAGGEQAQLPPARPVPAADRPGATLSVRVLVRGPDRPAPGPVELSVMRV
ncbi:hypothetical protein ACFWUZ_10590 [Streptomyces sp. NPDC058646]|uniref:hypothetical protein n=1 Tax=Streptomyces sp. NPDC058646 TaxID=3346574 RepID=UPI003649FD8F